MEDKSLDDQKVYFTTEDNREALHKLDFDFESQDLRSLQEDEYHLKEEPKIEIPYSAEINTNSDWLASNFSPTQFNTKHSEKTVRAFENEFLADPIVVLLVNVKQNATTKLSKEEKNAIENLDIQNFKMHVDDYLSDLSETIYNKIETEVEQNDHNKLTIIVENIIHPAIEQRLLSFGSPKQGYISSYTRSIVDIKKASNIFGILKVYKSNKKDKIVSTMTQCLKFK